MHILNYLYSENVFEENRPLKKTSEKSANQVIVEISNTEGMTTNLDKPASKITKTRGKVELGYN